MRILVLAPHPYFQVRGTPIDLDLVLRVLSERGDCEVDAVVYAEGEERRYPRVRVHRTRDFRWLRGVRPGFSLKKLSCDLLLAIRAWSLMRRHRYDVIHAGEEAVFVAMALGRRYGIPYLYDLDSSVAQQMVEKSPALRSLAGLLDRVEAAAIRGALVTLPVCNALADLCRARGARRVVTLHDISQLANPDAAPSGRLRREIGSDRLILLYVGNLESYQGVDLLLEGFAAAAAESDLVDLVIVGGTPADIAGYRARARALGVAERTHFLGPRPLEELDRLLADADMLAVPRIRGLNTPMKIFPYLHSGHAVLATDLPTHTQLVTPEMAMLAEPTPAGFARAILRLAKDPDLRRQLGARGRAFVEANHTYPAHLKRLNGVYDWVESQLPGNRKSASKAST